MNNGSDRSSYLKDWKEKVLAAVESTLYGHDSAQPELLVHTLSAAPWWDGCPTAPDILDPSAPQSFLRIPLVPAHATSYSVLLIAWPAGHETPVHDHDGLWGIELVLDGALQVESFSLAIRDKPHLVSRGSTVLGLDDSATFSDADFAHRCRNLSARQAALSLHVYGESWKAFGRMPRTALAIGMPPRIAPHGRRRLADEQASLGP
jgi:predicted metal-dependent enzyme (double-stranded beta helix superfamily)